MKNVHDNLFKCCENFINYSVLNKLLSQGELFVKLINYMDKFINKYELTADQYKDLIIVAIQ